MIQPDHELKKQWEGNIEANSNYCHHTVVLYGKLLKRYRSLTGFVKMLPLIHYFVPFSGLSMALL